MKRRLFREEIVVLLLILPFLLNFVSASELVDSEFLHHRTAEFRSDKLANSKDHTYFNLVTANYSESINSQIIMAVNEIDSDNDNDGFSNLHEEIAGTDIDDPLSHPMPLEYSQGVLYHLVDRSSNWGTTNSDSVRITSANTADYLSSRTPILSTTLDTSFNRLKLSVALSSESNPVLSCAGDIAVREVRQTNFVFFFQLGNDPEGIPVWRKIEQGVSSYPDNPECVEKAWLSGNTGTVGSGTPRLSASEFLPMQWRAGTLSTRAFNHAYVPDSNRWTSRFHPADIILQENNTGFDSFSERALIWEIDGNELVLNYTDGSVARIGVIYDAEIAQQGVISYRGALGTEYVSRLSLAYKERNSWQNNEYEGRFQLQNLATSLDNFALKFNSGNVGVQANLACGDYDVNTGNCTDPQGWTDSSVSIFSWQVESDEIVANYYRTDDFQFLTSCDGQPAESNCRLWRWRKVTLVAAEQEHFVLKIEQYIDYDNDLSTASQSGYIGIFTKTEPDSDRDGIPDSWESANGLNPYLATDAEMDNDGDGLSNYQEFINNTSPTKEDTDDDGISDANEILLGRDPLSNSDAEADSDNDGFIDIHEQLAGTDFNDTAQSPPSFQYQFGELYHLYEHFSNWADNGGYSFRITSSTTADFIYRNTGAEQVEIDLSLNRLKLTVDISNESFQLMECASGNRIKQVIDISEIHYYSIGIDSKGAILWKQIEKGLATYPDNPECASVNWESKDSNVIAKGTPRLTNENYLPFAWHTGRFDTNIFNLAFDPQAGAWISAFFPGEILLDANQTGFDSLNQRSFNWDVEANELVMNFTDGSIARLGVIHDANYIQQGIVVYTNSAGKTYVSRTSFAYKSRYNWQSEEVLGRFQSQEIIMPLASFALEFKADNTGVQSSLTCAIGFYGNGDCVDPQGWDDSNSGVFSWNVSSDQILANYYLNDNYEFLSTCDGQPVEVNCSLWRWRKVTLLANEGSHYVLKIDQYLDIERNGSNATHTGYIGLFTKTAADTDQDGMTDSWELANGLNPFSAADSSQDSDGDGLTNLEEYLIGTNPASADSDGDGMEDVFEYDYGLNPLVNDALEDADSDGLTNIEEMNLGTNPKDVDTDGDGVNDNLDFEPTDAATSYASKFGIIQLGDMTADGIGDLGFFVKNKSNENATLIGFNGNNKSLVNIYNTNNSKLSVHKAIKLNDMNNDGVPEVGFYGTDRNNLNATFIIFNGESNTVLKEFALGGKDWQINDVISLGDMNYDGVSEIGFAGINKNSGNSSLVIFDGNDGTFEKVFALSKNDWKIQDIYSLGDMTGDGISEIGFYGLNKKSGIPTLVSFDGSNKSLVNLFTMSNVTWDIHSVAAMSDMTGDDIPEIGFYTTNRTNSNRTMIVIDGANKSVVNLVALNHGGWDVQGVNSVGDINGDKIPDLGFYSINRSSGNPTLIVLDGDTRALVRLYGMDGSQWDVLSVNGYGDLTGDDISEIGFYATNQINNNPTLIMLNGATKGVENIFALDSGHWQH